MGRLLGSHAPGTPCLHRCVGRAVCSAGLPAWRGPSQRRTSFPSGCSAMGPGRVMVVLLTMRPSTPCSSATAAMSAAGRAHRHKAQLWSAAYSAGPAG